MNLSKMGPPCSASGEKTQAAGEDINAGGGYTTACYTDLTGDGLSDLVVARADNTVSIFANTGVATDPSFSPPVLLPGADGNNWLPANAGARIDCADWNADGLVDVISGGFEGNFFVFLNIGTSTSPFFDAAQPILANNAAISLPYNTHPRVFDLNQDNLPDLVFGINWGFFGVFVNEGSPGSPRFGEWHPLSNASGEELNIRSLNGDDTTPDFSDVDADGVLDLVSGGLNGRLFVMRGVSVADRLARIEQIMDAGGMNLGMYLESNDAERNELFGIHRKIRSLAIPFTGASSSSIDLFDWYSNHIENHSIHLSRQQIDTSGQPYVPPLAGQTWINLFESRADSPSHRADVAESAGYTGLARSILTDYGTLLIDNSTADNVQLSSIHTYLGSLPRSTWDANTITINEFLGPVPSEVATQARTGVNIFGIPVGASSENSFPEDVPAVMIDVFHAVLAHEIGHTTDAFYIQLIPELDNRLVELREQAGNIDLQYLRSQVGATFFQSAPQEFFASITNQWATSSEATIDLGLHRFDLGFSEPLNQALFFAEVFSEAGQTTRFHRIDAAGAQTSTTIPLLRDEQSNISTLFFRGNRYDFQRDASGDVAEYQVTLGTAPACNDLIDNDGDGFTDYPNDDSCDSPAGSSEGEYQRSSLIRMLLILQSMEDSQ